MLIFWQLFYLAFYLALLVCGAWCVSEGGDILGEKYDATIVGGFIIAWLNTAPETIFFITALETNNPNFAIGALSGSVIVVCTVAVGACVYIGAKSRKSGTILLLSGVRKQAMILGLSLSLMLLILLFGFNILFAIMGLLFYVGFIVWTIFHKSNPVIPAIHNSAMTLHHKHEVEEGNGMYGDKNDDDDDDDDSKQATWKGFAFLITGGVLIYLFSEPFISTVVMIGKSLGIGPLALAFFFAPVASEAPEILESITLSRKGKIQNINIAFSNLVGGTISKTTLLAALLCFYGTNKNFEWVSPAYTISLLLVMICAASTASFGLSAEHSSTKGKLLLVLFTFCGAVQFMVAYMSGSVLIH